MPAKRSSTGGALSWILAVVLVSVAAVGVGWLIGQQVLNLMNPGRSSVSKSGSADTQGYSYYPWTDNSASPDAAATTSNKQSTDKSTDTSTKGGSTGTPNVDLPKSTVTPGGSTGATSVTGNSGGASSTAAATPGASSVGSQSAFYRVRVGSFGTKDAAVAASKELEAQGYPIYVTGGGPYSIQVGAFASRDNAIILGDKLAEQGYDVKIIE